MKPPRDELIILRSEWEKFLALVKGNQKNVMHLHDVTHVRAACDSEDEGNVSVVLSLGLLRAIVQERDQVASRLHALSNGVEQQALLIVDLNRVGKVFCERSKP